MANTEVEEARTDHGAGSPASQEVNWYETLRFAERWAANHGVALDHHLVAGTPQWCQMPDDDARKLMALVLGGVREALTNDTRQAAIAEAQQEISADYDWARISRQVYGDRGPAYIPRQPKEVA